MKVMTVVGTRPELIKLSSVIKKLDQFFEHVFVHTGQNYDYELNEVFYQDLSLRKPDHYLDAAGGTAAATIAAVIEKVDNLLESEKPDAMVIYGDTNSCLCVIPAKRRHIPIFHLEAGNRCFDQRVPEEINRKIVDHLSDINFVHSEHARRYLINEGLKPETIIKTGTPMNEVIAKIKPQLEQASVLSDLKLAKGQYFVVSSHREENVDSPQNFSALLDSLNKICEEYPDYPVIVSTHPRTQKKLAGMNVKMNDRIQFLKPLGLINYLSLQMNSFCVLSDSGTITEESSILGFPAVMIRQAHERPEGMDRGSLVMSGLEAGNILRSIAMVTGENTFSREKISDYDNNFYSDQVCRVIQGYVPYINRTVWYQL